MARSPLPHGVGRRLFSFSSAISPRCLFPPPPTTSTPKASLGPFLGVHGSSDCFCASAPATKIQRSRADSCSGITSTFTSASAFACAPENPHPGWSCRMRMLLGGSSPLPLWGVHTPQLPSTLLRLSSLEQGTMLQAERSCRHVAHATVNVAVTPNTVATGALRFPAARAFSQAPGGNTVLKVFDENLKAVQRERALLLRQAMTEAPGSHRDPLLEHVTENLLDRLEDCRRGFPRALVLGGAFEHVLGQLQGRGGIRHVTVVDTSSELMEAAEKSLRSFLAPEEGNPCFSVSWMPSAPGSLLPVEPESYDVVLACLGLHWHNDLPGTLLQCRFALKPDGLFLGAMLGGDTLQEVRIACTLAEMERHGGVSPRVSPLAQVRDAGNLLTRAGLSLTTVDVDSLAVKYPSAVEVVEHLRLLGETNSSTARNPVLSRDTALAAAAVYQHMFRGAREEGEGEEEEADSVVATYQVIYMSGWAPHASQQQAKTRGSATVSFDDIQKFAKGRGDPSQQ